MDLAAEAEAGVANTAKDRAMATITAAKASAPRASFRRRPSATFPQLARSMAGASRRMWGVSCPGNGTGSGSGQPAGVRGPTVPVRRATGLRVVGEPGLEPGTSGI